MLTIMLIFATYSLDILLNDVSLGMNCERALKPSSSSYNNAVVIVVVFFFFFCSRHSPNEVFCTILKLIKIFAAQIKRGMSPILHMH